MIVEFPSQNTWNQLVERPELDQKDLSEVISEIYDLVAHKGDQALLDLTAKYDGVTLEELEFQDSEEVISADLRKAISVAAANITKFHTSQEVKINKVETSPGVTCWQESRPLRSVGLYVPGGTAPLFSTVLMLALPAKIAGCQEIVLCTPPSKEGGIHPAIAYAAKLAGVTRIFLVGGAQAVAAMCLGSESIPKVQKIFGPGNQYVTAAKKYALSLGTPIDMPAGPSELLLIASENTNPRFAAADLLSQAEHGVDSQVVCLSSSRTMMTSIMDEIDVQLLDLPRKNIAKQAMDNSKFILLRDTAEIIEFSNLYAPEHLIVADEDYQKYIKEIFNAGSVFLGNYCPESAGDYASGTNHTLPTSGFASVYSGVNLDDFVKKITFQEITEAGIASLGPTIEVMAAAEGLQGHKNAVSVRLSELNRKV